MLRALPTFGMCLDSDLGMILRPEVSDSRRNVHVIES